MTETSKKQVEMRVDDQGNCVTHGAKGPLIMAKVVYPKRCAMCIEKAFNAAKREALAEVSQ